MALTPEVSPGDPAVSPQEPAGGRTTRNGESR